MVTQTELIYTRFHVCWCEIELGMYERLGNNARVVLLIFRDFLCDDHVCQNVHKTYHIILHWDWCVYSHFSIFSHIPCQRRLLKLRWCEPICCLQFSYCSNWFLLIQNAQTDPNPIRSSTAFLNKLSGESVSRPNRSVINMMHVDPQVSQQRGQSFPGTYNAPFQCGSITDANSSVITRSLVPYPLVCDGCKQPINDQHYLCVGTRPWHVACLECQVCGKNLQWDRTCYFRRGSVFCRAHYERYVTWWC